jgi:predicted PurR-regulated permease PerM
VVYRALVLCALICCTLVSLSFALFAIDQASTATQQQVAQLSSGTTPPPAAAPAKRGQPRRFIDGAARTLTSPFRSLLSSSSQWTVEIFSTLVALLVYGLGLGYLARYSRVT